MTRGYTSFCAYVGVRADHALESLEELEFSCHWGITFRGNASAEMPLDAEWYWWGWDYAHAFDAFEFPPETIAALEEHLEDHPGLTALLGAGERHGRNRKRWTLDEVFEDALDVVMDLKNALSHSKELAGLLTRAAPQP